MEGNSVRFVRPQRLRHDKGRRSWSTKEERVLIAGMKEIIAGGWKSENGFKPGYLSALENIMIKAFPKTDLKATPHINSRIHTWKKNYSSLFTMLSRSGVGLDPKTHMIDASDEAWDACIKADANVRLMKFKSWPFYEDWCEIFGKDRANGEGAEDVGGAARDPSGDDALDAIPVPTQFPEESSGFNDEIGSQPENNPQSSNASQIKTAGKKCKGRQVDDAMSESVISFCVDASKRLGDIAKRIGYEVDLGEARKKVFELVNSVPSLTLQEKLRATKLLGQNTEDLEIFFSLPVDAQEEWIMMKLAGSI